MWKAKQLSLLFGTEAVQGMPWEAALRSCILVTTQKHRSYEQLLEPGSTRPGATVSPTVLRRLATITPSHHSSLVISELSLHSTHKRWCQARTAPKKTALQHPHLALRFSTQVLLPMSAWISTIRATWHFRRMKVSSSPPTNPSKGTGSRAGTLPGCATYSHPTRHRMPSTQKPHQ